jgi:hypothetical protein
MNEEMEDRIERIERNVGNLERGIRAQDWIGACMTLGLMVEDYQEIAADAAQGAFNQGATKKRIAEALGIPASALRGMKKQ